MEQGIPDINELVSDYLDRVRISDNLYMVGGRPREIFPRLFQISPINCPRQKVTALLEHVVGKLSESARDEEVITISSYCFERHVYLDISRHGRSLPPVDQVARFGEYRWADELADRPIDETLVTVLKATLCQCCVDRSAQTPSYVSFKFPVSATVEQDDMPKSRSRVRLLAIDDQTVILDLITAMCQSLDYEVVTALSGDEGLEKAEQQQFDIILADLAMPGSSGLEVARRLKEVAPGVPVILVTGWEVSIPPEQLKAVGIINILHKPFRIEQLTEIVRSATVARSVG